MRKKIIIIIVVMLILLGCTMLIVKNNDNEKGEMLSIPVNNNELLVCSEEGYNSIKVSRNFRRNNTRECGNHLDDN